MYFSSHKLPKQQMASFRYRGILGVNLSKINKLQFQGSIQHHSLFVWSGVRMLVLEVDVCFICEKMGFV
jgi:hypothetical protein